MRLLTLVLFTASLVLLSSCKKDDSPSSSSSDSFTNKLTVGTGMNASNFTLVGESSTIAKTGSVTTIYYRLESAADLGGAGVTIKIEKQVGSSYTTYLSYPYSNPQNYGHIIMSAFALTDAGSYRATGMITSTSATIAQTTFTIQ
jgi:hypothetical protein